MKHNDTHTHKARFLGAMRFSLILLLFATLFACSKQRGDELSDVAPPELPSYKISIDSLVRQAEGLGAIFGQATTKGRTVKAAGVVAVSDILFSSGATKSVGSSANTPKAYVVNYADDGGFAILADDNRLETNVLAYSESGNVDASTDNPGLLFYMSMADEYLAAEGRSLGLGDDFLPSLPFDYTPNFSVAPYDWGSTNGTPYRWRYQKDIEHIRRNKLLSVSWGQGNPYNLLAKNSDGVICPTGCVATAAVQIMSYHNKPSSITYFADGQTYPINWARAKQGDSIGIIEANIHYLMRDFGKKVGMSYDPIIGSGADSFYAINALQEYGYSCSNSIDDYDPTTVISEINSNRPVYVKGRRDIKNENGETVKTAGHAWVVDGYLVVRLYWADAIDYVAKDYLGRVVVVGQRVTHEEQLSPKCYMHVNWGWDGKSNGFFLGFDAGKAYSYDNSLKPSSYNYTHSFGMITNIR